MPNMGMKVGTRKAARRRESTGMADALFSKVQQRVLGVLFGRPDRSFYANEIIGLARSGTGAVQRELLRLEGAGIIRASRVGKQKHYQANAQSPVYAELRGLTLKTFGLADVLRAALEPVAAEIQAAFVYGSIAKGEDRADSDVDILVVSDGMAYGDLYAALEPASERLGRKVAPTLYSRNELLKRLKHQSSFIVRVLSQPKLWLIGGEDDIAA